MAQRIAAGQYASTDPVLTELRRLGIEWKLDRNFRLGLLHPGKRVQVRDAGAPRDQIQIYAMQMQGGAQFPPLLVTSDYWLVDGNTRNDAALINGQSTFPVYIMDISWELATDKEKDELYVLGGSVNNLGARRLTPQEQIRHARSAIALNWKPEEMARAFGLKPGQITALRKEVAAERRLTALGLDALTLRVPMKRALGSRLPLALNDDPFRGLAGLAADAGLTMNEILGLAQEIKATGSDAAQLSRLSEVRAEMKPRIRERKLTGRSLSPVPARRVRQALGQVAKYEGREPELVELDQTMADSHLAYISAVMRVLSRVQAMQEDLKARARA